MNPIQGQAHSRWGHIALTAIFCFCILSPLGIPYKILALATAAILIAKLQDGNLHRIGLQRPHWLATLGWALALSVIVIVLIGHLLQPLLENWLGITVDTSAYGALKGNFSALAKLWIYALFSAAIGEEIVFRGFLLNQITAIFGDRGRLARPAAVLTSAAVFGFAHLPQGAVGVITTGLVGALFGWAFFRSGRNLPALMLAHMAIDTYGLTRLYLGM